MIQKDEIWELTSQYKQNYIPNKQEGWASLQAKMAAESPTQAKVVQLKTRNFSWLKVAAIFAVFAGAAFVFQQFLKDEMQTLATAEGMEKNIQLADGTTVWLNETSELTYPENFKGDFRTVKLEGEAFFDVAKNPNQPFIIEIDGGEVRVVGTSFNVRSHDAEDFVEVEVATGKVVFTCEGHDDMAMLPNTKCNFNRKSGKLATAKSNDLNGMAWKRKELRFNNTPLKEVFESMERFYKIDLTIENPAILDCGGFTTRFKKNGLKNAFDVLSKNYTLEFVKENDENYSVKGGKCLGTFKE